MVTWMNANEDSIPYERINGWTSTHGSITGEIRRVFLKGHQLLVSRRTARYGADRKSRHPQNPALAAGLRGRQRDERRAQNCMIFNL
jgi:hypothetical protein